MRVRTKLKKGFHFMTHQLTLLQYYFYSYEQSLFTRVICSVMHIPSYDTHPKYNSLYSILCAPSIKIMNYTSSILTANQHVDYLSKIWSTLHIQLHTQNINLILQIQTPKSDPVYCRPPTKPCVLGREDGSGRP